MQKRASAAAELVAPAGDATSFALPTADKADPAPSSPDKRLTRSRAKKSPGRPLKALTFTKEKESAS